MSGRFGIAVFAMMVFRRPVNFDANLGGHKMIEKVPNLPD